MICWPELFSLPCCCINGNWASKAANPRKSVEVQSPKPQSEPEVVAAGVVMAKHKHWPGPDSPNPKQIQIDQIEIKRLDDVMMMIDDDWMKAWHFHELVFDHIVGDKADNPGTVGLEVSEPCVELDGVHKTPEVSSKQRVPSTNQRSWKHSGTESVGVEPMLQQSRCAIHADPIFKSQNLFARAQLYR